MQSGRRHALRALRIGGPVRGAATLLHESRIPTDHFQDSLPKMPVPALSDTLSKFLYFAEPLVSDDEHLLARRGASAFAGAEGQPRGAAAGVLEPDVFHTKPKVSQTPLWREAVRLMPRSVAFYGAAATGAYALDMSQYANLFRSTRLPRPELDELSTCSDSRHVALFAVCLDGSSPEELGEVNRAMLHGRGIDGWLDESDDTRGIDRWFDKSFQLVVTENAKAAINFEHSWGDGVSVMTDAFTTAALKKGGVSPDGMMQMSFQLAMAKMSGRTVSTYESASTAAFKHGRTETIRAATPESRAFTDAFTDPAATPSARAAAMRAAVRNHSRVSRDALIGARRHGYGSLREGSAPLAPTRLSVYVGAGMDRHLWVLQRMAAERGLAPPLFESEAYRRLSKIVISTSTLSSPALANGGFGPFHPDCFAVGYVIRADGCGGQIMTYQRDSTGFADCMVAAMREMRDVLHVDS
ncbi:carnitine O-acyltransferase [Emiliania huxleyi CCMP1516]|uniref:Choline/carnitine acyltransferase domain-containing protein n=2 Tax=Emiliania huxleyi TaxID=2903 RepID=A0A0D3K9A1_EMIH1|nr:carnitine O-acyltransferase [Emiliania huxleyi CCMP1516]EOD32336.1 carnitine O-acyltransferase [Emiliania huxleyi CCMP1516]|eukprot:XP_005784765.1 carnitine O-acyltransferase [Emiliania huxleyi CCMP1516]